jgi:hypothetical protein
MSGGTLADLTQCGLAYARSSELVAQQPDKCRRSFFAVFDPTVLHEVVSTGFALQPSCYAANGGSTPVRFRAQIRNSRDSIGLAMR